MDPSRIKKALIEQKQINLSGNLYHRTQVGFAYNSNHIEGSTITEDETESIFNTGTVLADKEKILVLKDMNETKNHFTLFKHMIDTLDEPLTEEMIKKFHYILKDGILTDENKAWFSLGEYKKLKNYVGNIVTSLPKNVSRDMGNLMNWYNNIGTKTIEDIIEYHVRFEKIHPFQDGNGRVGRIIMFRECLNNNIVPFYIEDRNKDYYIRGIKEYQTSNNKSYLINTCLNSQDNYAKMCEFFLDEEVV